VKKSPNPKLLFLLDYDGTLTDFTHNPEDSNLTSELRGLLHDLRKKYPVILVSGRHVEGLRRVSKLKSFPIVGTHGFEASQLPGGLQLAPLAHQRLFRKEAAALWKAIQVLNQRYPGIHIEKKPFSSTLHYRSLNLSPTVEARLHGDFRAIFKKTVTVRLWTLQDGKKMIEAMPKGYTKGKAVKTLVEHFPGYLPIFAGDDLTDLTALKALGKKGLKIAVGSRIPKGFYDLRFDSPLEFLDWLKNFSD
jgi:trehalose 6-phosphate phosphatase